ncbi:MAG: prolyl oligopeptidase family serine peptidase [Actinomycetota bacterium]
MPADPYRWLEDFQSPETRAFLETQEQRTRSVLERVPGREAWGAALERRHRRACIQPLGGGFFLQSDADDERAVLVARLQPDAEPTVLLDPRAWEDGTSLVFAVPSPTGAHVAFGVAKDGADDARLRVLEVATRRVLPSIPYGRDHSDLVWLRDGSGFYYSACPESGEDADYWKAVHLYLLASLDAGRRVFGEERRKEYWCRADVSECGRYAIYYKYDFVHACDIYLHRFGETDLTPVATGMSSLSRVQVIDEQLLIHTDRDAPRGRCCLAPLTDPTQWRTIIPEGKHVLQTVTGAGGRLYAVWSHGGHHVVTVHDLDGAFLRQVELPSLGTVNHHDGSGVVSGISGLWRGNDVRVSLQSVLQLPATYRYDYAVNELIPEHVPDAGFSAADYVTEQIEYQSSDGTQAPMLIVRHREAPRDGQRLVRLTGYGGFGITLEPRWTPFAATWLELGGMLAYAGIRGGGEYGKEGHDAARGRNRQRAFDDYIAAARWLVAAGWTQPERIASRGNSNGGLLVAVTAGQEPDAFGAVVSRAPLLDMLEFPRFGFLASATVEYGSPDDSDDARYLEGYSPYHNVHADVAYPPLLFIAALSDRIAPPYDPLKMVARLQAEAPRGGPYLLLPLHASGHAGGTMTGARIAEDLDELCFCMGALTRAAGCTE